MRSGTVPGRRAAAGSAGPNLPGAYALALKAHCAWRRGVDYRLLEDATPEEFGQYKAAATVAVAELFDELVAVGEPVIAARWDLRKLPGAPDIPWLAELRGPRDVLVYADDTVEMIDDTAVVDSPDGKRLRNPIA